MRADLGKMEFGGDYSFLAVRRVGQRGAGLAWRVEAAILGPRGRFTVDQEQVSLDTTKRTLKQIAAFAACKTRRLEVALSGGGWLRVRRHRSGRILVRYRVCHWSAGAALEGKVGLAGESAEQFCQQLGGPL